MKFFVEVYMRSEVEGVIFEWKKVRPSQGKPYEFDTVKDAVRLVEMCYSESCGEVLTMLDKTMYVAMLPEKEQKKIEKHLMKLSGMTVEGLNNMMDGRICDMEEVIPFQEVKRILGK